MSKFSPMMIHNINIKFRITILRARDVFNYIVQAIHSEIRDITRYLVRISSRICDQLNNTSLAQSLASPR